MRSVRWFGAVAAVFALALLTGCASSGAMSGSAGAETTMGTQTKGKGSGEGSLVLVTNWGEDTCSLVNVSTAEELARIKTCSKPYDVKIGPEGRYAYATCSGSSEIAVIDLQAMLVAERIGVGQSPRDIAITDDGRAMTANAGDGTISVVDLERGQELYEVEVGSMPYGIDLWRQDRAVVTLWGGNRVAIVETGRDGGEVVQRFKVGSLPYTVVVSEPTGVALVSTFGSHEIYSLDLRSMEMREPTRVGRSPWGIGISPDGATALVANFYSGDASLLRVPEAGQVPGEAGVREVGRVSLGPGLRGGGGGATYSAAKNAAITRTESGRNVAVVTDLSNNRLMIVDMQDRQMERTVSVGKAPYGIAFVPRSR